MREFFEDHFVVRAIVLIALAIVIMFLQAWAAMFLWNWVVVDLFNTPVLSFWVAFGLRLLCSLLFKGKTIVKKSED